MLLSARVSVGRTPSPLLRWVRVGDTSERYSPVRMSSSAKRNPGPLLVYPLHTEPPMLRGPEDGIYAFDLVLFVGETMAAAAGC